MERKKSKYKLWQRKKGKKLGEYERMHSVRKMIKENVKRDVKERNE